MARRQVTQSKKDRDGDILALCNPGANWSPVDKATAIREIESKTNSYFVRVNNQEVDVNVVPKANGEKYLRTDRDPTKHNNLDDLPNC
jgi:hypothetical protein